MARCPYVFLTLALTCTACVHEDAPSSASAHVLLVPDWQNDVVHRIALDGTYEGDFLSPARNADAALERALWTKPSALLFFDQPSPSLWLLADRALSSWDGHGRPRSTIVHDTSLLETPTCALRLGDKVFVVSPDMKEAIVFDVDGRQLARFGYPELHHANDCKLGPDGLIYVGSSLSGGRPGLISTWDPAETGAGAKPRGYSIPGDSSGDGTYWVQGLVFDDDGSLLITELSRGRLERWDLARNQRIEVLLDSDESSAYLKLERGPDGMIYMAGANGVYRFRSGSHAKDLEGLAPFFDVETIRGRYAKPFNPAGMTFVPRSALGPPR